MFRWLMRIQCSQTLNHHRDSSDCSQEQLLLVTVLVYKGERIMKPRDLIIMVIAIRLKELTTCSLVKRVN